MLHHGQGAPAPFMLRMFDPLIQSGRFRVYCPDLPGHGACAVAWACGACCGAGRVVHVVCTILNAVCRSVVRSTCIWL